MIILGIDPGTSVTGFGIVAYDAQKLRRVVSGTIDLEKDDSLSRKLAAIYDHVVDLTHRYRPSELSIENVFYSQNVKSALKLGHARAAAMLGALHRDVSIHEYSPKDMKMAVVGNGNASKEQVQYMVKKILGLSETLSLDESDALGLAICHAYRSGRSSRPSSKSWAAYVRENPHRIKQG